MNRGTRRGSDATVSHRSIVTGVVSCLVLGAGLVGCEGAYGPDPVCTLIARPAVTVTVEHAETGEPVDDALVVAREGTFADSARTIVSGADTVDSVGLASERAGTYEVTVEAEGFSPWIETGVLVEEGVCNVETVELVAGLAPLEG